MEVKNLLCNTLEPSEHISFLEGMTLKDIEKISELETSYSQAGGYTLEAKARSILTGLGFTEKVQNSSNTELSGGWRMRLALAKMFLNEPNFIILDEPTNHLDLPSLIWFESFFGDA